MQAGPINTRWFDVPVHHTSGQLQPDSSSKRSKPRDVPAVTVLVDYRYDLRANGGSGFFEDHPEAQATLDLVAREMDSGSRRPTPGGHHSLRWQHLVGDVLLPEAGHE